MLEWKKSEGYENEGGVNVKIKSQNYADLFPPPHIKVSTHYKFSPPKQSTKYSPFKFCKVYSSIFIKKDLIYDQINGFCIMTMHLPTQHFQKSNF
jgi:hypothetical protein